LNKEKRETGICQRRGDRGGRRGEERRGGERGERKERRRVTQR